MTGFLSDCIAYVRRIIKSASDTSIPDSLIIDYINRFWIYDLDARIETFDLKTTYRFNTIPNIVDYNMPFREAQLNGTIARYPLYQGFSAPATANGIPMVFTTDRNSTYQSGPYWQTNDRILTASGSTSYTYSISSSALIAGHVDVLGLIEASLAIENIPAYTILQPGVPQSSVTPRIIITATGDEGQQVRITDSGQFLSSNQKVGFLQQIVNGVAVQAGTVNYLSGDLQINFQSLLKPQTPISLQFFTYAPGLPRFIMYFNNTLTILPPCTDSSPAYIEIDAYLTPAAFISSSQMIPFGYMVEYLARGAARKILSDLGDGEQFAFYEPLFKEQELLVLKRSQRQKTATRTQTIYSQPSGSFGPFGSYGGGTY